MKQYLVFDWGGTLIKYALMNSDAEIIGQSSIPTVPRNADRETFLQTMDSVFEQYREAVSGVAISSPGIIDSAEGIIHAVGVFPYLNECSIREVLQQRWQMPVSIENDGKAAALAELWQGSLKDCESGAVMTIGTAIGGGLVLDGKLRRGKDFFAGEFSGACINIYAPEKPENYWASLGVRGLTDRVARAYGIGPKEMDGHAAFAKINAGEEKALRALKEYTDLFAIAAFNLNIMLDLDRICIGGGISRQPVLIEYLRSSIEDLRNIHPDIVAGTDLPLPEVTACRFFNEANLIGALYHLLYE